MIGTTGIFTTKIILSMVHHPLKIYSKVLSCQVKKLDNYTRQIEEEERPDELQIWFFGLLIVTGFSFAAPIGILLVPLLRKSLYDRFMTFLVALGIGSMSGSCLFILIPQAFNITELKSFDYTTKSWLLICSIYGFFIIDRIFQFGIELRRRKKMKRKIHMSTLESIMDRVRNEGSQNESVRRNSNETQTTNLEKEKEKQNLHDEIEIAALSNSFVRQLSTRKRVAIVRPERVDSVKYQLEDGKMIEISPQKLDIEVNGVKRNLDTPNQNVIIRRLSTSETEESDLSSRDSDPKLPYTVEIVEKNVIEHAKTEVASVVYMILFGCSANNFVDGMSIGAAFSDGLIQGVSIGLAVFTQQLPEGLGTLAILVNSGLGIKRTLTYNFIPIILSYLGFVAGLFLDNLDDSYDDLIFSISAGMYFYIFLGTLIPEIREQVIELLKTDIWEATLSTVLQISGIALGVFFMFFMSSFSDEMED